MKKIKQLLSVFAVALMLTACDDHSTSRVEVRAENDARDMKVTKFQFEDNHYLQFEFKWIHGGGITLNPDYIFKGDTITYKGERYIKL